MEKNAKIEYFYRIISSLAKYKVEEIENSIISYFLNELGCKNREDIFTLLRNKASKASKEIEDVLVLNQFPVNIETLIEFFEFLIAQEDKTENGIVFTPKYIADYISDDLFNNISNWNSKIKIIDPGCGCGIFLISAIEKIHSKFGIGIAEIIENNIFGIDILEQNVVRCRYVLQLYCLMNGVYSIDLNDNLVKADSLMSDWSSIFSTKDSFDYVIGNPPYVNTHDMSKATVSFLKDSFATTQSGVFNIFYAFIEHGLNQLSPDGYLEFIVPNNFLTIKSAESLRSLLQNGQNICSVLDFADNMIFKPVRTYNCIIKLSKKPTNKFKYATMDKTDNIQTALSNIHFNELQTIMLDRNGWILVDEKTMENISRIEHQKFPIKSYIRTGIATLRDGVYLVDSKDGDFFKIVDNEKYHIDAAIVKPIYKIPGLKYCKNAKDAMQHIIFPYKKGNNGYELIPEEELEKTYKNTYAYLLKMKPTLDERDKGKGNSSAWYAYGRTQGLNKYGKKLLFPTFASYPKFIYIDDENALFCNGYAVFEDEKISLDILTKILNSSVMNYYVSNTSYSIEGGYYCYQKKYIERFSIPEFTQVELEMIKNCSQQEVDIFLQKKYNLEV